MGVSGPAMVAPSRGPRGGWLSLLVCAVLCTALCHAAVERPLGWSEAETLEELGRRLATLSDAERASVAQLELDTYFHRNVPLFHLFNRVPGKQNSLQSGKRGLDFGLNRGFSALRAAQLRMALKTASDPLGPGR